MVVYHVGVIIYLAVGLEPLPLFDFLYTYAFFWGIVWFLKAESDRSEAGRAYCPGVTIGIIWVFLLPYHLLQSRGIRGLIPLFALLGTYLALQMAKVIVYVSVGGALQ